MKATVKKSTAGGTAAKGMAGSGPKAAKAGGTKAPGKTSASTQAIGKPATPARKTVANPIVSSAPEATAKVVAKTTTARVSAKKVTAAAKSGTVTAAAAKRRTESTPDHAREEAGTGVNSDQTAPGGHMSSTEASTGLIDKIEQTVVSKVSEVATKTSKPNPAVAEDGVLLTEEQLLKMSDKDYMNQAQLAFFKARLQQLEKDLLKNAGETTEHLRETVLVPDPADRATIEEEHALELRTRDRERKLLKKVQQAIASIDSGDYGWCEETGEPIGIPRLLARPTATLSLEAQQRRELKQKLYGD
jgi:DnaK suppressor protein